MISYIGLKSHTREAITTLLCCVATCATDRRAEHIKKRRTVIVWAAGQHQWTTEAYSIDGHLRQNTEETVLFVARASGRSDLSRDGRKHQTIHES